MGLTGGVASGKSTVAAMLAELGAVVIDADQLAREVVAPGTPGLAAVVEAFGPEVLTDGRRAGPAGDGRRRVRRRGGAAAARGDHPPAGAGPGGRARGGGAGRGRSWSTTSRCWPRPGRRGHVRRGRRGRRARRDPGGADGRGPRRWTREEAQARVAAQATRERAAGRRRRTSSRTPGRAKTSATGSRRSSRSWPHAGGRGRRRSVRRPVRRPGRGRRAAQLLQRLALELTHPLGGDAVLGADVGQLVLAAVAEAVAGPDDVGRALVEQLDQRG